MDSFLQEIKNIVYSPATINSPLTDQELVQYTIDGLDDQYEIFVTTTTYLGIILLSMNSAPRLSCMSTGISTCVSHPLRLRLGNKLLPPLLPLLSLNVLLVMCPITPIWALVIPPTMDEAEANGVAIVLTDAAMVVVAGVSHQWWSHQSSPSSGLQPVQVYPLAVVIALALLLLIL